MPPKDEGAARTEVAQRVETFLGEFRMIIPAMAALFGFQLMAAFQPAFEEMSRWDRLANFAGLACTAAAILFLLVPASYHRFIAQLEETEDFLRFARTSIGVAFAFIPFAIGFTLYVQALRTFGSRPLGVAIGAATVASYLVGWWMLPKRRAAHTGMDSERTAGPRRTSV